MAPDVFGQRPMTLTLSSVAHLLGISEPTFRAKRPALEALGFPPKLPGVGKYSFAAVRRWIDANGAPAGGDAAIDEEAAALEAEYGQ